MIKKRNKLELELKLYFYLNTVNLSDKIIIIKITIYFTLYKHDLKISIVKIEKNSALHRCRVRFVDSDEEIATTISLGGAVASWLVRSSLDRAVRVRALAGDIVLCSWTRHLTLTVPLSTQVYKWVPAYLMLGGNPAMDWHPIQGGVEILLVASC